jgi:hypothetical protein
MASAIVPLPTKPILLSSNNVLPPQTLLETAKTSKTSWSLHITHDET